MSEIEGPSRRGRPLGGWKDREKEYVSEGGAYGGGEALNKEGGSVRTRRGGGCSAVATPCGDVLGGREALE